MLRLLILCAIGAVVKVQSTPIEKCVDNTDLPLNVYVEGCITAPCEVFQQEYVRIRLIFKAPRTIQSMRTLAFASLFGVLIPYDLGPNAITCNFFDNTYCPLMETEVVQYTLDMYIESFFPVGLSANVEFSIIDQDSRPVICARLPIRIFGPR